MYLLIHHFTVQNLEGIQMNVLMEREDGIADGGVVGQAEVFLRRPRGRGWMTVPIGENLQTVLTSTKYISGGGTGLGGLLIDYGKFDWSQSPSPALQARIKKVGKKLAFTARVKTELITNLCALMTPQAAYMETLGLFSPELCADMSVPDTTIRLSIGLEAGEDLLEDITQSLT